MSKVWLPAHEDVLLTIDSASPRRQSSLSGEGWPGPALACWPATCHPNCMGTILIYGSNTELDIKREKLSRLFQAGGAQEGTLAVVGGPQVGGSTSLGVSTRALYPVSCAAHPEHSPHRILMPSVRQAVTYPHFQVLLLREANRSARSTPQPQGTLSTSTNSISQAGREGGTPILTFPEMVLICLELRGSKSTPM